MCGSLNGTIDTVYEVLDPIRFLRSGVKGQSYGPIHVPISSDVADGENMIIRVIVHQYFLYFQCAECSYQ